MTEPGIGADGPDITAPTEGERDGDLEGTEQIGLGA